LIEDSHEKKPFIDLHKKLPVFYCTILFYRIVHILSIYCQDIT